MSLKNREVGEFEVGNLSWKVENEVEKNFRREQVSNFKESIETTVTNKLTLNPPKKLDFPTSRFFSNYTS